MRFDADRFEDAFGFREPRFFSRSLHLDGDQDLAALDGLVVVVDDQRPCLLELGTRLTGCRTGSSRSGSGSSRSGTGPIS